MRKKLFLFNLLVATFNVSAKLPGCEITDRLSLGEDTLAVGDGANIQLLKKESTQAHGSIRPESFVPKNENTPIRTTAKAKP